MSEHDTGSAQSPAEKVAWGRVGLYYAIAFGMVCVLGIVLWALGADMTTGSAVLVFQLTVAFMYMPMPLVAGLVVERVAKRPALIRATWPQLKRGWWRIILVSAGSALGIYAVNLGLTVLLGNLLGVPGVGRLVATQAQFLDAARASIPNLVITPKMAADAPPVALLYVLGAWTGVIAGFTINGLFAFGEEYGWRGVLMDELRPLGPVRANLLTGVMWGLWHAPVILLGFNYGVYRWLGIPAMCVWLIPFSFLLWRSREYSGSVIAPAVIHGAFNGSSGFFLLLVAGRNPLIATPVGLVAALTLSMVAGVVWAITAASIRRRGGVLEPVGSTA